MLASSLTTRCRAWFGSLSDVGQPGSHLVSGNGAAWVRL